MEGSLQVQPPGSVSRMRHGKTDSVLSLMGLAGVNNCQNSFGPKQKMLKINFINRISSDLMAFTASTGGNFL